MKHKRTDSPPLHITDGDSILGAPNRHGRVLFRHWELVQS